jgi:hypothetical protein
MFLATIPDVRGVQITRSGLAKVSRDEQAVHGPAGPGFAPPARPDRTTGYQGRGISRAAPHP